MRQYSEDSKIEHMLRKFEFYNGYLFRMGYEYFEYIGNEEYLFKMNNGEFYIFDWFYDKTIHIKSDRENMTDRDRGREFIHILDTKLKDALKTQRQLSYLTGISEHTISKYARGDSLPSYGNLLKICMVLKCSADDFSYDRLFR